jgi:hypothetical protein
MATSAAQDAAIKERIIKHMNADHRDSVRFRSSHYKDYLTYCQLQIRRYLEYYKNASFYEIHDARMTDMNLNNIKINYAGTITSIPLDPPMQSLKEARERLVQMDKDAVQALGRSDIPVTTFVPPYANLVHLFNFTQCILTYIVFCRIANFQPGSLLYDNLFFRFPGFVKLGLSIQPYLFPIMVAIHAFEAFLMTRKLKRHGLTPFDGPWWLWVGTCFVEGFTSFWRMDTWVAEKRKEKEAKKH